MSRISAYIIPGDETQIVASPSEQSPGIQLRIPGLYLLAVVSCDADPPGLATAAYFSPGPGALSRASTKLQKFASYHSLRSWLGNAC